MTAAEGASGATRGSLLQPGIAFRSCQRPGIAIPKSYFAVVPCGAGSPLLYCFILFSEFRAPADILPANQGTRGMEGLP